MQCISMLGIFVSFQTPGNFMWSLTGSKTDNTGDVTHQKESKGHRYICHGHRISTQAHVGRNKEVSEKVIFIL